MSDESQSVASHLPRSPMKRRVVAGIAAIAMLVGGAAFVFAGRYDRPGPATEPPLPGVTVKDHGLAVAGDAPAWNVLQVAHPAPPAPQWTDPIPARIVFDEGRTSRLGSPLAGRVTAVMVVRGQQVKAGARLFSVSSPNL